MLRLLLIFPSAVGALFVASAPRSVRADESTQIAPRSPHRIGGGVGRFVAITGLDVDGHYNDKAEPALALGVEYAYAKKGLAFGLPGFFVPELEAGVTYVDFIGATSSDDLHARLVLPYVGVRPYFGSEDIELGFSLRAGGCFMFVPNIPDERGNQTRTHFYLGGHLTFSPDVRLWVSRDFALELAADFTIAPAHDVGSVKGWYVSEDGGLLGIGFWLRAVFAP